MIRRSKKTEKVNNKKGIRIIGKAENEQELRKMLHMYVRRMKKKGDFEYICKSELGQDGVDFVLYTSEKSLPNLC